MTSLEDTNDPTEAMNAALILFAKAFQLTAPTNNNQRTSSNPRNHQIAQPNRLVVVPGIANKNGTGNVVTARAEGNRNRNQARCYNCRGLGHIARNCTARPRRRDAVYLQTQLLIAQKEKAGIQLQAEEFDFMTVAGDLDKIEEVNANFILMANLQHASTCGTQLDKALVYDIVGSAEVQLNDNCYDNEIFNMFTQEEQYMDLLEPIPEPQLVTQNDNNVTYVALSMVQSGGIVETNSAPNEEIRAHQETVYLNLVDQVAQEELFLSNVSNMVTVSKTISIPNEDLSDDTTPSVVRKFLNEVKSFLVTLQHVVKQRTSLEVHNWSSSAHKEVNRIISHEIAPIINQVDARVQNFKIQFLQEASKFVRDFKALAKEANESLDKQKSLELEIERLLKASVKKLELCIIKKEKEYAILWNNWYTKCEECKYDKISYDKAYNDMKQKVKRLQAQLRDLKGKSSDTPSASNTLDSLNQKLESKIVELEFQVVFKNTSESMKNTSRMSVTPHVDKPKLSAVTPHFKKLHALMSSHSVPQPREFNVVKHRNVVQICLWCIDSGCSKHMTGNIKLLINFVWKFLGTVRFENDHIAAILGYGDLKWGNITITKVYFIEGLGHNLYLVGQFCDADLEVAFRRNTCFIKDLDGVELLKGNNSTNIYTINLYDMASASPTCLLARATPTKSWLWHQRLSHLNFNTINDLAKNDLVSGLLKFKYAKEHICPSCEQGKSKRTSHPPKLVPNSKQRLHLLHMCNAPILVHIAAKANLGYYFIAQKSQS
uniref:Retrovirus-related Pol polyprotein from transposon TNT 1-94 n=1 Tax=Tanacetum cinerariifolium TaxID=118510 RepID=A0A6L2LTN0_TANCI|nr:retrovirus-related Pol polyprotein from transposon TNT 1-94 [Tanacetum cinerariifolium]